MNFKNPQVVELLAEINDLFTYGTILRSCIEAKKPEIAQRIVELLGRITGKYKGREDRREKARTVVSICILPT